ncbi:branched-chain amino acid aminotransferase [Desulfosarcina sp. OttesenSCG-928-A07]|nr:branched-chain amino acid aminotransferase [Desulfosarcina sp. OttesenSCG-928-A07]
MDIRIQKTTQPKPKPDEHNLGFGRIFTDHMLNIDYSPEKGWHNPRVEPYGPFSLDPSTMVLHYGQGVFEGMKAYRTQKGGIQLFRPRENFRRLNRSCHKLCIPPLDETLAMESLKALLRVDQDWIPSLPGTSLYIRPTIIATDPFLGVHASRTYRYYVILCPVGAYYAEGFNPVKILVTKDHVRAVRGGVGDTKTMANYAASLYAGEAAEHEGYTQVLWLDGVEQKYIEEVGSMNIFFVINGELVTPALNGSILPGITRDSVLSLTRSWGLPVSEKRISMDEVLKAHASGQLQEVFGTGTAAVISPVGELKYGDQILAISDGKVGPLSNRLFDTMQKIQYGEMEGPEGWVEEVR